MSEREQAISAVVRLLQEHVSAHGGVPEVADRITGPHSLASQIVDALASQPVVERQGTEKIASTGPVTALPLGFRCAQEDAGRGRVRCERQCASCESWEGKG